MLVMCVLLKYIKKKSLLKKNYTIFIVCKSGWEYLKNNQDHACIVCQCEQKQCTQSEVFQFSGTSLAYIWKLKRGWNWRGKPIANLLSWLLKWTEHHFGKAKFDSPPIGWQVNFFPALLTFSLLLAELATWYGWKHTLIRCTFIGCLLRRKFRPMRTALL